MWSKGGNIWENRFALLSYMQVGMWSSLHLPNLSVAWVIQQTLYIEMLEKMRINKTKLDILGNVWIISILQLWIKYNNLRSTAKGSWKWSFSCTNERQFPGCRMERRSSCSLRLQLSPTIVLAANSSFPQKISTHFHVEGGQSFVIKWFLLTFSAHGSVP
jgi:hypothetical protein